MNKKTALVIGIPSGLVIIGGVIFSVLIHLIIENVIEGTADLENRNKGIFSAYSSTPSLVIRPSFDISRNVVKRDAEKIDRSQNLPLPSYYRSKRDSSNQPSIIRSSADLPLWTLGIVFIIPGFFGFLSALIQKKGLYITSIIFSTFSLLIMAGIAIVTFLFFILLALTFSVISEDCRDEGNTCKCRDVEFSLFKKCSYYQTFFTLTLSAGFFVVFTWIALLVMFVICCYYSCCAKSQSSAGFVLNSAQQPMIPQNPPPGQYFEEVPPSKV